MILVGDTAGDNHLGYDDTLPVTLEEALSNTAAVNRAVEDTLVIGDLPFLTYGTSIEESVRNAGRFMKEAGADAVKLETAPYGETTIEIGAGRHVDGQVLVISDVLGLGGEAFRFSKQYAALDSTIRDAVESYVADVRNGAFPTAEHAFDPVDGD
jgi:ketopantoate hydroxymethyltransferase